MAAVPESGLVYPLLGRPHDSLYGCPLVLLAFFSWLMFAQKYAGYVSDI